MSIKINKLYVEDNFIVAANVSGIVTYNDEVSTITLTLKPYMPIQFNGIDSLEEAHVINELEGIDRFNHLIQLNRSAVETIQLKTTTEVVI